MERPQKRPLEMSHILPHNKKRNMAENSKLALGVIGTTNNNKGKLTSKLPEITDSIERKVKNITISTNNGDGLKPLRACDINVIKNQALANNQQLLNKQQQAPAAVNLSINPFIIAQKNNKLSLINQSNKLKHELTNNYTLKPKQQAEPIVITIDDEEELDEKHKHVQLEHEEATPQSTSQTGKDEITYEEYSEETNIDFNNPATYYRPPKELLDKPTIADHDRTQLKDVCSEPHYAWDIFEYYRIKEEACLNEKYLTSSKTCEINAGMRAILVDWMVEVQESFELNHETLYLSVKIMDQYLMKKSIKKSQLQLLGITCLLIAAKFDERIPPAIDDFVYSSDAAFSKRQVIHFEIEVLKALNFFIGFPLSYRFLRRFARCGDCDFRTLTLARFILEMSLMEYDLIDERESKIAAAALFLAIEMLHLGGWNETLELYTGYSEDDLMPLLFKLNDMISAPMNSHLKTVRTKYEHRVFLEVARVKPLPSR